MRKYDEKRMDTLLNPYLDACEVFLEYSEKNTRAQQVIENKVMMFDEGVWKAWHNSLAELLLLLVSITTINTNKQRYARIILILKNK